jgi:hypothetical protein
VKPIITPQTLLPLFLILGFLLVPIGGPRDISFSDAKMQLSNLRYLQKHVRSLRLTIHNYLKPVVLLFYGLTNIHQNHGRYVQSLDYQVVLRRCLVTICWYIPAPKQPPLTVHNLLEFPQVTVVDHTQFSMFKAFNPAAFGGFTAFVPLEFRRFKAPNPVHSGRFTAFDPLECCQSTTTNSMSFAR